jgi:hypothetical protein
MIAIDAEKQPLQQTKIWIRHGTEQRIAARSFCASRWASLFLPQLLFALAMTIALGVKAPLDLSVFSASAGAFLLAAYGKYPLSADAFHHTQV